MSHGSVSPATVERTVPTAASGHGILFHGVLFHQGSALRADRDRGTGRLGGTLLPRTSGAADPLAAHRAAGSVGARDSVQQWPAGTAASRGAAAGGVDGGHGMSLPASRDDLVSSR